MSEPTVAGIFLIDIRLLSSYEYLDNINESLLKFYQKFPQAYVTLAIFDSSLDIMINFQKLQFIPKCSLTITTAPVKIFDAIGQILESHEWLLPIYDISKVHVWIASAAKDQGSQKYTIFDIVNLLNEKRNAGWKFYFPFAKFEEIKSESFHII